jgi:TRAP-type C4-dicarboxylate transport system permease large subunit
VVIGIFTPPFGTALFLGSIMTGLPFMRLVKAMVPYYLPLVIVLFIITIFPQLVLWLPNLIYG